MIQRLLLSALPGIYVIKLSHILSYFALHGMISFKKIISIPERFHFKTPAQVFHFCHPCRFFQSDFHLSSYRLTVEIRLFQSRANQAFHQETKLCKIRCSNSSSSQTICQHLHQCQISKYNLAQCLDQVIPQEYVCI